MMARLEIPQSKGPRQGRHLETSGNCKDLGNRNTELCKAQTCADIHETESRILRIWDVRVEKFLERIKRTGMSALLHGSCQQTKVLLF